MYRPVDPYAYLCLELMQLPYPRSFLGLLVLGLALALAPLVAGLGTSAIYTDRLARRAQAALAQTALVTQSTRRLATLLRELERSARQSAILGEASVPEIYLALRKQFLAAATRLDSTPFESIQRARLQRMRDIEAGVFAALSNAEKSSAAVEQASARFDEAHRLADETIREADALTERERQSMSEMAEQAQRVVYWQLAAAVPLAILVAVGVALAMVRPVRKLDTAIGAIGAGRLSDPISVSGPRDIRQLGERLEWLRSVLLGIEQQKNRFMRHIAHELKTPLSAVLESTDLLLERVAGALTPTQRELADILRRNALELQRLVEDLLQLGEAQFRRLHLENEALDLPQIVQQVAADHELAARTKGVSLSYQLDADAARFVADREKVRVILDNLISNAIKHSPNGGTIEVRARRDAGDILLGVHDEGPGIAREDRDNIFDPFYQGRTTGSGMLKNSGVGLSIVREYAAAHGGDVQVADDDRGGALLCVRLPLTTAGGNAS